MASKIIAAIAAALGVSLAAGACSSAAPTPPKAPAGHLPNRPDHARAGQARNAATGTIGPGCASLAPVGLGSRAERVRLPVATAIARTPVLSELAKAIRLVGMTRTLDSARSLTVFAPDNTAFEAIGAGNRQALLATRSDLGRVLTFHVVAGRLAPVWLARHRVLTTLGGTKLYLSRGGHSFYVNNASVSCGNLQTANATVYIVNHVIVPAT